MKYLTRSQLKNLPHIDPKTQLQANSHDLRMWPLERSTNKEDQTTHTPDANSNPVVGDMQFPEPLKY